MNVRERFIEVMQNINTNVGYPKWELGYYGETIDQWYNEGLSMNKYPRIPKKISTPTASLYHTSWNRIKGNKLPKGIGVVGGGLYWPTQGFPIDNDVKSALNMDIGQILVNVNQLFQPMFKVDILEEDDNSLIYIDVDGVKREFLKKNGAKPAGIEWVIKDWKSWRKLKDERLDLKNIRERFPSNWDELVKRYKDRDYPLVLGGYPYGYFGTLAHLIGDEHLFCQYSENPKLIHEIQNTFTELWIAVYSEVLSEIDVDLFIYWEDISAGSGSLISPQTVKEFMLPYYKRLTGFLKEHGVNVIFVHIEGDCFEIIPLFIEAGVTGLYPVKVSSGMDLVKVRKYFPRLQLMGGIPKSDIQNGKDRIDEILEPAREVLRYGGYIPFCEDFIPPEMHWNEFKYYREKLNSMLESAKAGN